jgi:3-(methylthio)propanoyl-CoA dehydrogenase
MENFFKDNADLQFYFEKGIDWEPLVRLTEGDFKIEGSPANLKEAMNSYREMADLIGEFVANEIAPFGAKIDEEGVHLEEGEAVFPPTLQGIFDKIKEMELHAMTLPRDLGGTNVPLLVYWLCAEMFARGDVSVMAHHSFHAGIAMALLIYSIEEGTTDVDTSLWKIKNTRFSEEIQEIARGDAWGCMDITEPDAGSDMGSIKSLAEQDEHGNWVVSGQKIFITSGHAKYHLVIARTEKAKAGDDPFAGLGGLSMFLVPAYEDLPDGTRRRWVTIDRLEEKIGHHGSVTAALTFDRAPARLIGKRGEGFKYMLTLMNNARIAVGFESLGLCESAYRVAKAYAAERKSMGKTIDQHEMIADYLDGMESDIEAIRALAVYAAYCEELGRKLTLYAEYGQPAEGKQEITAQANRWRKKARRVTPLLKYFASEKAVEMGRLAIQIHGGNGYMKEYPAEKLLRDALVFPIYEGTSQIQSLMAMKDTMLGILKNPQKFARKMAQTRWNSLSRDPLIRRVAKIQLLSQSSLQYLMARTAGDKFRSLQDLPFAQWPQRFLKDWDPKRDFAYAMLHAERLTRLLIDEHICELLLKQAQEFPQRRAVLERYLERSEPRCRYLHDEITTTGSRLLASLQQNPEAKQNVA